MNISATMDRQLVSVEEASKNSTKTLLVIDDIPANLELLFTLLTEQNFRVLVFQEGQEALEQVLLLKPDLILLDVLMPELDGFEVCKRLKSQVHTQAIPVIFMTALTDTVDKVKGLALGAVDYVTKPFDPDELLARINTHLTLSELKQDLARNNHALTQQNEDLQAFAYSVSHDLKSPLNSLLLMNELCSVKVANVQPELSDLLAKMERKGRKMAEIIDALLLLASARFEKTVLEPLNMLDIIKRAEDRWSELQILTQANVLLPDTLPLARGYGPWIEEVWVNYVINALKYGGSAPNVELGGRIDNKQLEDGLLGESHVRFYVRDSGSGLNQEQQQKLFRPFVRLDPSSNQGHGLGLSIIKRLVERCGGAVGVDSCPGQGSEFYFTLPCVNKIQ